MELFGGDNSATFSFPFFVLASLSPFTWIATFSGLLSRARTEGIDDNDKSFMKVSGFATGASAAPFKFGSVSTVSEMDVALLLDVDGCSSEGLDASKFWDIISTFNSGSVKTVSESDVPSFDISASVGDGADNSSACAGEDATSFTAGSSVRTVSDTEVADSSLSSLFESEDSDSSSSFASSSLSFSSSSSTSSDACDASPESIEADDAEASDGPSLIADSIDAVLLLLLEAVGFIGDGWMGMLSLVSIVSESEVESSFDAASSFSSDSSSSFSSDSSSSSSSSSSLPIFPYNVLFGADGAGTIVGNGADGGWIGIVSLVCTVSESEVELL